MWTDYKCTPWTDKHKAGSLVLSATSVRKMILCFIRESKIWKWQDSLRQGVRKIMMKEKGKRNNPLFLEVWFFRFFKEEVELLCNIDERTFTGHVPSISIKRFSLCREKDFRRRLINLGVVAWSKKLVFYCLKCFSIVIWQKRICQNEANYFLSKITLCL